MQRKLLITLCIFSFNFCVYPQLNSSPQLNISKDIYIDTGASMYIDLPNTEFNQGNIITDRSNINYGTVAFGPNAKWSNASHNAHVNGFIRMYNEQDFIFPSGHDQIFQPLHLKRIDRHSLVDVAYNHKAHENLTSEKGIVKVSDDFYFYRYDLSIASFSLVNVGRKGALNKSISLNSDFDIIESDQSIVESYTELENLDKLYDRAKSWKVSNTNVTFPSKERLLARKNQNQLDFGSLDLIIDNNASYPLSVDKINNVVRVKANTLVAGTKFNSLSTSGTISVEGGANIEVGYKDNTGTHKFIALNEVNNSDILIRDNSTTPPTSIVSITAITGDYKTHFLAPSDTSKIEVLVSRANHSTFQENYPEKELSFVRTPNLQLTQVVAESQIEMLNLATKILQKEEAFYRALDLTNPTLTVTHTLSNMTGSPSVENQEAILSIMYKVFNKVVANHRKLKN